MVSFILVVACPGYPVVQLRMWSLQAPLDPKAHVSADLAPFHAGLKEIGHEGELHAVDEGRLRGRSSLKPTFMRLLLQRSKKLRRGL